MCVDMPQFITDIEVSLNQAEEQELQSQGFHKIDVSLNQDNCGDAVYLWYKKQHGVAPITRIQVSFNDEMCKGLISAGYVKVYKNLTPGRSIFLWYLRGTTSFDMPIVKLEVSTNTDDKAEKMKLGWERAGCNLSGVYENWVYLWVKRAQQTYIYDVTATNSFGSDEDLFQAGYTRIDQTTNTFSWGINSSNFLWYRLTTEDKSALSDLQISTNRNQYQQYQQQEYSPVSVNLNEGTGGNAVYLWHKREKGQPPVENMLLLLNRSAIKPYQKAGVNVIQENINYGNNGEERHLCVMNKQ